MQKLPQGWVIAPLRVICRQIVDGSHNPPKAASRGQPMLSARNIHAGQIHFSEYRLISDEDFAIEDARTRASPGDVLLTIVGTLGRTAVVPKDFVPFTLQRSVAVLKLTQLSSAEYLAYALEAPSVQRCLQDEAKGTAQKGVYLKTLAKLEVAIAPLNEQRRIVAKLEKLLNKVDSCQKRLAKIPSLLKRFRQAVLDAACSGYLTADWREYNEFLGEHNEIVAAPEEFPTLPKTWRWRPLLSVCDNIVDCPHSTPKWTETGHICARTTNFKPGYLDLSEVRYVSGRTFEERIERLKPKPGDILYSREGGILGVACMIPKGVDLCLGQRMMLFRVNGDLRRELLMHCLNGSPILRHVGKLTGGSASPHLNVRDIKMFPTPVPPLAEQDIIIRRIDELFTLADQVEARYAKAKENVDSLKQSILAKAFRGELVPQDPNDEPVSALLERIREARTTQPANRSRRRANSSKSSPTEHLPEISLP